MALTPQQLEQVNKAEAELKEMQKTYKPKKAVTSLSTTSAVDKVNKGLTKLDKISPTTATGYVPPTTPVPETKAIEPKAYFTNDSGQEAEYTQAQLKKSSVQNFLRKNGYVQTRTGGPSFDTTTEIKSEIEDISTKIDDLTDQFNNYNVDEDPAFKSQADGIRNKYANLKKEMERVNYQREQAFQTLGLRTGATQYAGGVQMGIAGEELNQANTRMAELVNQEQSAIAEARIAYETGKYANFAKQMEFLDKVRADKQKELEKYNKTLADTTKKLQETVFKASRDNAIAGLMQQGITDPAELLQMLNYDDEGKQIGDFTADEVQKTIKSLAPDTDLDKLTGDSKNFFILKKAGSLPESITNLPEGQQLFAYIRLANQAERKETGGGGNTLTLAEAKALGLPPTVAGMSESVIVASLQVPEAPSWFVALANAKTGTTNDKDTINSMWNDFRVSVLTTNEDEGGLY